MIKLLLSLFILLFFNISYPQFIEEEFDYPAGQSLLLHGYSSYLSGTVNPIRTVEGNLIYEGYSNSGIGNMIQIGTTGQKVIYTYKEINTTEITSGTVYASMLVSVDSAQANGDFFFSFAPLTIDTNFRARTLIKLAENGNLAFGLNKATTYARITFSDSIYQLGETYLLIVGYKFVDGENNDSVKLWINPDLESLSEPPADIIVADPNKNNEDISIGTFVFRQGYDTLTSFLKLDKLKIDTTWSRIPVSVNEDKTLPDAFSLEQNYPNPFNPVTKIRYNIPAVFTSSNKSITGLVTLKIYDLLGNEIATLVNEEKAPGSYEVEFNAADLSTGIYFYRLQASNFSETKKLVLLK